MKTNPSRLLLLGTLLITGLPSSLAAVSQSPLFMSSSVEPNILYILDDSGSMGLSFIPDICAEWNTKRAKSSAYNALYYDPNVTYSAPLNQDGTSLADASFEAAKFNGYDSSSTTVNLSSAYRPTWSGSGTGCTDGTGSNDAYSSDTSEAAYYYVHDATNTCSAATVTLSNQGPYGENNTSSHTHTVSSLSEITGLSLVSGTSCNSGDWGRYADTNTFYTSGYCRNAYFKITGLPAGGCSCVDNTGNDDCYDKVVVSTSSGPGDTDERANFANWYQYYRTRLMTAKAGSSRAFAELGTGPRVGYGKINQGSSTIDGVNTTTLQRGVRAFSGTDRQNFFTWLFGMSTSSFTPLRRALDAAGQYYKRTDDKGPYDTTPGVTGGVNRSCRQNYTILMTDGYWNSSEAATAAARADNDGTDGPTITGPNSQSYTYTNVSPFTDGYSNTLADVAMYYWKNDLTTLSNNVPTSAQNPAFWQHMVTFGVGLGVPTANDSTEVFEAIDTDNTITWPDPEVSYTGYSDLPAGRADELLHASVNSRGGFFNAQNPTDFAAALSATLENISSRSSGSFSSLASNTSKLSTETFVYQSSFDSSDWSGHLVALPVLMNGTIGTEAWDAASEIPTPYSSRNIRTWSGSAGIDFAWASLTGTQQTALGTENVFKYLRGDQTLEEPSGSFRTRSSVLGDIINSDPVFVGSENFGYGALPDPEGAAYDTFRTDVKAGRTKMLYVGANDGMLHGFNAGTGVEEFAYVPNAVFPNLASLASTGYTHKYFVDGSPFVGDAYLGGAWKSILVGTTGAGGKAVFALDVTNPSSFGNTNVLWEFTHADLGYTIGQPIIARLNNDRWAAIFGNGYESTAGTAKLFIVYLDADLSDGWTVNTDYLVIDTTTATANGLSSPALYDSDGDFIADYVYAGDLQGNLWKFKLTGSTVSQWASALKTGSTPTPLFKARNASNQVQPISAPLEIGAAPAGKSGIMIYFGTGQYHAVGDAGTTTIQSLYGIWDNFANNNSVAFTCGGSSCTRTILQQQSILFEDVDPGNAVDTRAASDKIIRVTSDTTVNYDTKRGWYMDLVPPTNIAAGERVVSVPLLRFGRVIFTTLVPSEDPCKFGGDSWLMELAATTGSRLDYSAFDLDDNSLFDDRDFVTVTVGGQTITVPISSMKAVDGLYDTPVVISAGEIEYKLSSGTAKVSGGTEASITVTKEKSGSDTTGRVSWRQLLNE